MISDEIREKMAEAARSAIRETFKTKLPIGEYETVRTSDTTFEVTKKRITFDDVIPIAADAALSAVLPLIVEKCAEVADNPPEPEGRGFACVATGRSIASAIRSLARP